MLGMMTNIKNRVTLLVSLHHRIVVSTLFVLGGVFSLYLIYQFLFTAAAVDRPQENLEAFAIKQAALERVALFGKKKLEQGAIIVTIPNSAFAVPVAAP